MHIYHQYYLFCLCDELLAARSWILFCVLCELIYTRYLLHPCQVKFSVCALEVFIFLSHMCILIIRPALASITIWALLKQPSRIKLCTYIILHTDAQTQDCRNKKTTYFCPDFVTQNYFESLIAVKQIQLTAVVAQKMHRYTICTHLDSSSFVSM